MTEEEMQQGMQDVRESRDAAITWMKETKEGGILVYSCYSFMEMGKRGYTFEQALELFAVEATLNLEAEENGTH